jgi:hypothetical protein
MTFEFNTRDYLLTHGKEPRGYGSWAFMIETKGNEPVWAPQSTYADAKKWVRGKVRAIAAPDYDGIVSIYVCT